MMEKDFDFDDIGKQTPYRTPDGFFEEMQRKVMERAGMKPRPQPKSRIRLLVSAALAAAAAVLAGFFFAVPSLLQADKGELPDTQVLASGADPMDKWINELSDEELEELVNFSENDIFLSENDIFLN